MIKPLLIVQILFLSLIFQSISCKSAQDNSIIQWKTLNDKNDLVFIFKKETTYKEMESFTNQVFNKDRSDGVADTMFGSMIEGYKGGTINFTPNATPQQREAVKKEINDSELIYKVYEDVIPNEIKGL